VALLTLIITGRYFLQSLSVGARLIGMRGLFKRISTPLAMLMLAGGMEYGLRVEKSLHVDTYYRELGASREHMSPVSRALMSVLLATGDKIQKHKDNKL
jgi:hypothetical protein